ncbi:hypothetical protein NERG_02721 [Nematocida ausubeli]|uniref:Uncharacterized protein n=1 Tax=Nematocida ausubeli (strain ATCC PRA-371 / ERTm2) TaxID=1913371 RepID=H8ZGK0_NEMA1|nr:hypothetical protein NERG_02721 [Nematocida ausubeli]
MQPIFSSTPLISSYFALSSAFRLFVVWHLAFFFSHMRTMQRTPFSTLQCPLRVVWERVCFSGTYACSISSTETSRMSAYTAGMHINMESTAADACISLFWPSHIYISLAECLLFACWAISIWQTCLCSASKLEKPFLSRAIFFSIYCLRSSMFCLNSLIFWIFGLSKDGLEQ